MSAPRVRVVLADDHPMFLEALTLALRRRPDLELVATAGDGRAALAAVREHRPDVALLDVRMPGLDGLQVLNAIERDKLGTRVVFLSATADGATVFRAVAEGAAGFLPKEAGGEEILDAIAAVARGDVVVGPSLQAGLARQVRERSIDDRPVLTERELQVLRLAAEGLTGAQIGARLHLSPATVKTHLQKLYDKLEVSDRAAAVATAMRRGLLE